MRFMRFTVISLFISIMLISSASALEWSDDLNLSKNQGYSWRPSIASNNSTVHIVWTESEDWSGYSNYEIYYKKSDDNGSTWGSTLQISDSNGRPDNPEIAVADDSVYILWEYDNSIYFRRSKNNGALWESTIRLADNADHGYITIAASGQIVFTAWPAYKDGKSQTYFSLSDDRGATWTIPMPIAFKNSGWPQATITNGTINVVLAGTSGIGYMKSTDKGMTWSSELTIPGTTSLAGVARIVGNGNFLHVVSDALFNDTEHRAIYSRSVDNGATWSEAIPIDGGFGDHPSVGTKGNNVYVVYSNDTAGLGKSEIYFVDSNNQGLSWNIPIKLTYTEGWSHYPRISVNDYGLHVVWFDFRDGTLEQYNSEIYYKNTALPELTLIGDINDDKVVNIFDLVMVGKAFGSNPGSTNWNPIADLKEDSVIDIFDLVIVGKNFGNTL